jgi:uncharacterized damage-inducible protein DinB
MYMAMKDAFIAELKSESILTQKMLERVPLDKASWKPHEKSMTLGRLATHVAEIPHWVSDIILADEYDFLKHPYNPRTAASKEEMIGILHTNMDRAIADLDTAEDNALRKKWIVRRGEQVFFELQKKVAIRSWAYSHLYHHRGQLSVYLRLLDIQVPGMYGPSADER